MNVNKKFDRLKQWGREKMGSEVKTDTSDDFKNLQTEMELRQEGMERLKKSTNGYIKWMSKRDPGEDKEKQLPVGYFGSAMSRHGGDFEPESEFGMCLATLGRANERIARMQETYCANATSSWLESTERSLVQMKDYQDAAKRLDQRRLAYDTALRTTEKSKKEDYRLEEQLRSQKQKYEESIEEVYRRMMDIKEAECETVADLTTFLEAELAYYDRCREVLLQVKKDWPMLVYLAYQLVGDDMLTIYDSSSGDRSGTSSPANGMKRPENRSRAGSLSSRFTRAGDNDARPVIGGRIRSEQIQLLQEHSGSEWNGRTTYDARSASQSGELAALPRDNPRSQLNRMPTDPSTLSSAISNLRVQKREGGDGNVFADGQDEYSDSTPQVSRVSSWSQQGYDSSAKKTAPPPPPCRSKKPPPPPPTKRTAPSASIGSQY